MTATSIGDLAQSFLLRHRNSALKQDMARLTQELATGQVADKRQTLAGNHNYLTQLERNIEVLAGYKVSLTEATIFADNTQTALGRFQEVGEELANSLVISGGSTVGAQSNDIAQEARTAMSVLVGTLNTRSAGRALFGGTATDRAPLASAETLISALSMTASAATTPGELLAAVDAWFDDPSGFDAVMYQGGTKTLAPVQISDTETVSLDITATEPRLKNMLKFASLAALAGDSSLNFSRSQQAEIFLEAGTSLLGARDQVTALRSKVGGVEAQIDNATARHAAELTSTNYEKDALLSVDPYEAATKLEEVQFQLQSLYSVTVRMSQLSLVNFL